MTIEFKQQLLDDFIVVALLEEPAAMGRIKLPDWQRTCAAKSPRSGPGECYPSADALRWRCKVGDIVTFAATAGMDTDYGVGRKIRMMHDEDVDTVEVNTAAFASEPEVNV